MLDANIALYHGIQLRHIRQHLTAGRHRCKRCRHWQRLADARGLDDDVVKAPRAGEGTDFLRTDNTTDIRPQNIYFDMQQRSMLRSMKLAARYSCLCLLHLMHESRRTTSRCSSTMHSPNLAFLQIP